MAEASLIALTNQASVEELPITFHDLMSPVLHTANTTDDNWHA